jgi:hypothetical protein
MIRSSLAFGAVLTIFASGCAEPATAATKATAHTHEGAEHWYPLDLGSMWTFQLKMDPASPGMLSISCITMRDSDGANLLTGKRVQQLRVVEDGIVTVRPPSKAYLLRVPFALGEKWTGLDGSTVTVTKVDAPMTVDAGTFSGCVETTETAGDATGSETLKTTYCPEVGPVQMEILTSGDETVPAQHIIGKLRAYGPPTEIMDEGAIDAAIAKGGKGEKTTKSACESVKAR